MRASSGRDSASPALQALQQNVRAALHAHLASKQSPKSMCSSLPLYRSSIRLEGVAVAKAQQVPNLQQRHKIDWVLWTCCCIGWAQARLSKSFCCIGWYESRHRG